MNSPWDYTQRETDPATIRQLFAQETADCVPVIAAVPLPVTDLSGQRSVLPVAYLDIAKRSDLQQLYAQLVQNDDSELRCAWHFVMGTPIPRQVARLDVEWRTPLPTSARIAFDFVEHRAFLFLAAQTGEIQCCFGGKPSRGLFTPVALSITTAPLRMALATTELFLRAQGRNN